jgi:hypothetical protein
VIAVFTKYDQFRRDIRIKLEDQHRDPSLLDTEVENVFNEHYVAGLTGPPPFIRLESEDFNDHRDMYPTEPSPTGMHKPSQHCNDLIEITANALSGSVVALMLLAVQRDCNLGLSINYAIRRWVLLYHGTRMRGAWYPFRVHSALMQGRGSTEGVIRLCILAFPSLWVSRNAAF